MEHEGPAGPPIERRLAAALAGGRFEIRYHPVFELATGRLVGADASVRWPAPPGDDRERAPVIAQVVHHLRSDLAQGPAAVGEWWVRVSFGLGPLVDRVLAHEVLSTWQRGGAGPDRLRVGVREGDLALALVAGGVGHLVADGLQLDVAHFGTGRLSPSALRPLPVGAVRVRVDAMVLSDQADQALLRSIVEVADGLGVDVIAEGVDADDQLELAMAAGIRFGQGFRWGSPGSLAKLLATWARTA